MAEAVASPGPLTPVPVVSVTRPAADIPGVVHLAAVWSHNWNTLLSARPLGTDQKTSTSSGWAGVHTQEPNLQRRYYAYGQMTARRLTA